MPGLSTDVAARHRVLEVRDLTESTYVLRFERDSLEFDPGQYLAVGVKGDVEMREYSVYSCPADDFLEILVKEVPAGSVSRRLRRLSPGDELAVDGPFGFFVMDSAIRDSAELLFVATGTGVSPFHCFARAYPGLRYRLLHGIRTADERYGHEVFPSDRVVSCISRQRLDQAGEIAPGARLESGRVTEYLRTSRIDPETHCYLCGSCDMIYEAFDVLKSHGVQPEHMYAEVYF